MGGRKKSTPLGLALRLLSFRDRTIKAMEEKLTEKGLSADEIAEVIKTLTDEGLLNDERYARDLLASRIRNKNWGPRKISMDLIRKGVPREVAHKVLSELDNEAVKLAAQRALKKWKTRKGISPADSLDEGDIKKAYSHLESRGFNGELIARLLRGRDGITNFE